MFWFQGALSGASVNIAKVTGVFISRCTDICADDDNDYSDMTNVYAQHVMTECDLHSGGTVIMIMVK